MQLGTGKYTTTNGDQRRFSDGAELPLIPPHLLETLALERADRRVPLPGGECLILSQTPLAGFDPARLAELRNALATSERGLRTARPRSGSRRRQRDADGPRWKRLTVAGACLALAATFGLLIGLLA